MFCVVGVSDDYDLNDYADSDRGVRDRYGDYEGSE